MVTYYGSRGDGVHLPFNFQLIELPWHARAIADAVDRYEALLPSYGWPNWVLGNHDNPRIATRIGRDQARIAAMLLLTLRGTPTLYYGDEIGMHNVAIPPDRVQDPFEKNVPGLGLGRDPCRTPMQWSAKENAGFSNGPTWLPLADDVLNVNVEAEMRESHSILNLYRHLIELRRREPALAIGQYVAVPTAGDVLAYRRHFDDARRYLIVLNFAGEPAKFHSAVIPQQSTIVLSTHMDREREVVIDTIELRANEGVIIELT
jgi:alpha-glucosidase